MRRTTRLASLVLLLVTATACGSAPTDEHGGQWHYTDDRDINVTTEKRPERIVAQVSSAAALKDFGVHITGTFGPLVRSDGSVEPEAGSLKPDEVTDITGSGYGEINMEKLAGLHPDLIVSGRYPPFPALWYLTEEQEKIATRLAPTVAVDQSHVTLTDAIESYRKLSRALGANTDTPEIAADKKEYQRAADRLRGIGERMRADGRTILTVSGSKENLFVADPRQAIALTYYQHDLGLPIITPRNPDASGNSHFEELSWENADAYPADVMLWDTRAGTLPPEEMKKNPVFAAQPAVRDNKFVEWDAVSPMSYKSFAKVMNHLADELSSL